VDPDRALVDLARSGNQEAFADLVRRYQVRVFNLARSLTANDADADDLAQEVFIKVFRGLRRFRGDSSFRTWLYRVAVNVVRSHLRRRTVLGFLRRQEASEAALDLDRLASPGDFETEAVQRDEIDRALGRLPTDLRVAVTLRDVEGLEYKEIAVVLGVPIGTVMSRIARGRGKLRPMLAPLLRTAAGSAKPARAETRDADV
jgi:RNA polymerase sigma-70 factor, ECF subfamily